MSKLGSKVEVFGDVTERIKKRQQDKLLKENEVKLEVMRTIKDLQAQLTTVSFLDALAMMDPSNPLKKELESFESDIATLRTNIEGFVVSNQFDIPSEVEEVPEEEIPEEEIPEEKPKEKKEDKEKAKKKEEEEKISVSGEKDKVDQEKNDGDEKKDTKDKKVKK
jgi:hypothetical protein